MGKPAGEKIHLGLSSHPSKRAVRNRDPKIPRYRQGWFGIRLSSS